METRINERDEHLDLLQIDAVRAGEGSALKLAHCAACPRCRREVEQLGEAVRLLQGVRGAEGAVPPPRVERAVLEAYRQRQGRPSQVAVPTVRPWWRTAAGMAAAAALTLGLALPLWRGSLPQQKVERAEAPRSVPQVTRQTAPAAPAGPDLNRDGRTDILDAFLLARSLRGGTGGTAAWDGNGDGRTDAADVAVLGRLAVAL